MTEQEAPARQLHERPQGQPDGVRRFHPGRTRPRGGPPAAPARPRRHTRAALHARPATGAARGPQTGGAPCGRLRAVDSPHLLPGLYCRRPGVPRANGGRRARPGGVYAAGGAAGEEGPPRQRTGWAPETRLAPTILRQRGSQAVGKSRRPVGRLGLRSAVLGQMVRPGRPGTSRCEAPPPAPRPARVSVSTTPGLSVVVMVPPEWQLVVGRRGGNAPRRAAPAATCTSVPTSDYFPSIMAVGLLS
jgi:hypothetical protein